MNNKILIDNLRCIPDFPKKGINFRDVTTLYKNAECVQIMLNELEAIYKDKGITKTRKATLHRYQRIFFKRVWCGHN